MADLKKQYKKLKELAGNENSFSLSDEDALQYQDVLELLKERKYVMVLNADNENWYFKTAEWDGFEEWLNEVIREEKHLSRREWTIGIVCAIVGALVGLIPYIASLLGMGA